MAKRPSIITTSSGYQSSHVINSNFTKIGDAFDNTLSLDGSTPNAMLADIDLNSNDLINVGTLYVDNIVYNTALPNADFPKKNFNWMGFFRTWQNGHGFKTETTTRQLGGSGLTVARTSFADDKVTIYHIKGTNQPDGIRIQRNATNANTASANIVMNFTQVETAPLLGKTICFQISGKKSSTWSGSTVTMSIQYSKEPQQPIIRANGEYTNGNTVLDSKNIILTTDISVNPEYVSAILPVDAIQISLKIAVTFSGTAGSADYVDFEGAFLTIGTSPPVEIIPETFSELLMKAKTRYQTTYPYGAPRGVSSKGGSIRAVAINTSTTSSVIVPVRFDPPMAVVPQVLMQSPLSGTENRWENETTGLFVNGLPYNINDQGVTLQNNGAVTAGDVLLCHWTARCVF
jgi:hypothetical protein